MIIAAIAFTFNSSIENLLLSQVIVNFISSIMFITIACKTLKISLYEFITNHKKLFLLFLIWAFIQWLFKEYISLFFMFEIAASLLITYLINYF